MVSQKKNPEKKKKSIPKDKIIKMVKDQEYIDLGEPFGESARRYLSFQLSKLIDKREIAGTVITPEGVYISLTGSEVKDIVRLIKAKGICNLEELAEDNKWNPKVVALIAKSRINLIQRKDDKIITRDSAKDILYQSVIQGVDVDIYEIAEELQLKKSITRELLQTLIDDGKIEGVYVRSSHKFLPMELLEESILELVENLESQKVSQVTFGAIAENYSISDDQVYNILLKLYNVGDIDVQLNLAQKICLIKENIETEKIIERIPEEERKLDIEDLTQK
ncbi:MAG: hypothetical protein ACTSPM_03415 [Candidatus Heimdallarchaeota archaeon]